MNANKPYIEELTPEEMKERFKNNENAQEVIKYHELCADCFKTVYYEVTLESGNNFIFSVTHNTITLFGGNCWVFGLNSLNK